MAGKQAKILSDKQIKIALAYLAQSRNPIRNRTIFLLSCRAGLRPIEIAKLRWSMVIDPDGLLLDQMTLPDEIAKGPRSGRTIFLRADLKESLLELSQLSPVSLTTSVIKSERGGSMSASTITNWFYYLFHDLGFHGYSAYSGRRTFCTRAARKIAEAGGSLRDVQQLMGHSSLQTTQGYIDESEDAKRKVVELI